VRGPRHLSEWSELWFSVITVIVTGMRCWILALSTEKLATAIVAYIMRTIWAVGSNTLGAPIGEDPFK
jgi:hypothetical protein